MILVLVGCSSMKYPFACSPLTSIDTSIASEGQCRPGACGMYWMCIVRGVEI